MAVIYKSIAACVSGFLFSRTVFCDTEIRRESKTEKKLGRPRTAPKFHTAEDRKFILSCETAEDEGPKHTLVPIGKPLFLHSGNKIAVVVTENGTCRAFEFIRPGRLIRIGGRHSHVTKAFVGYHGEIYVLDEYGMFTHRALLFEGDIAKKALVALSTPVEKIECGALHCVAMFQDPKIHPAVWLTEPLATELPLTGDPSQKDKVIWDKYQVDLPEDVLIKDIEVGDRHTLVLDQDGNVWGFGDNRSGQLGFADDVIEVGLPMKLQIGEPIKEIFCGEDFSVFWTESDKIINFGGKDLKGKKYPYMDGIEKFGEEFNPDDVLKVDVCGQCAAFLNKEGDIKEFGDCPTPASIDAVYMLQYKTLDFSLSTESLVTLAARHWIPHDTATCIVPYH